MAKQKNHKVRSNRKKQVFFNRDFLNDIDSEHTGSIKAHLEVTRVKEGGETDYTWSVYGGLEIRDCSRRIDLAFDGDTKKYISQIKNGVKKYDAIIAICEAQKDVLVQVLNIAEKEKNKT